MPGFNNILSEIPILPIYFHAKNSALFYKLSNWSDILRSAKLPSEVLSQKNRVIKIRIGKPISIKDQKEYTNLNEFTSFIRKKTYMLANPYEKDVVSLKDVATSTIKKTITPNPPPEKIATSVSSELIEQEVEKNRKKNLLLQKQNRMVALGEMMENIATKFGSFCKKMKEDNQENITKINNFFLNLKEKFEDGFNPPEEEQEEDDEILE